MMAHRGPSGHTLLELLVVVAIIAIIAAVAIPSYDAYARKGRQEELKARMLDLAAAQERHFAARGRYATTFPDLVPFGLPVGGQQVQTGWQIGDHQFLTGAVIKQESGQGFWIVGKSDIDRGGDPLGDCCIYFSRGIRRPAGADEDLVWLYDDAGDRAKTTVSGFPPNENCLLQIAEGGG